MKTFAERLRYALDLKGFSQYALARSIGVTSGEISRLCGGKRGAQVSYERVVAISRALGISDRWLGLGEGHAPTAEDDIQDPLPNRSDAIRIARDGGLAEAAIEHVKILSVSSATREYSVLQWLNAIQLAATFTPPTQPPPSPTPASHTRARANTPTSPMPSIARKK